MIEKIAFGLVLLCLTPSIFMSMMMAVLIFLKFFAANVNLLIQFWPVFIKTCSHILAPIISHLTAFFAQVYHQVIGPFHFLQQSAHQVIQWFGQCWVGFQTALASFGHAVIHAWHGVQHALLGFSQFCSNTILGIQVAATSVLHTVQMVCATTWFLPALFTTSAIFLCGLLFLNRVKSPANDNLGKLVIEVAMTSQELKSVLRILADMPAAVPVTSRSMPMVPVTAAYPAPSVPRLDQIKWSY